MPLPDFELLEGTVSNRFSEIGIKRFSEACKFIENLPYGRISYRDNLDLVLVEKRGTCSSKHGILARLCEENGHKEIELIAGIFLMSPETHVELTDFFKDKTYNNLPEMHCYFRLSTHDRYDFTSKNNHLALIEPKLVREQRIEPHQSKAIDVKDALNKKAPRHQYRQRLTHRRRHRNQRVPQRMPRHRLPKRQPLRHRRPHIITRQLIQ